MSVYPSFGARLGLVVAYSIKLRSYYIGATNARRQHNILVLAGRFKKNQGCSSVTGDLDYVGYFPISRTHIVL